MNLALRRLKLDGVEHFTVHDMRRTARTHMAALGVARFVAERALNHKVRDVEGIYNHTTVRLKVEQNQLVGREGWFGASAIGLQGA